MLELNDLDLLKKALAELDASFSDLPDYQPASDPEQLSATLGEVARRMRGELPYGHPLYAGQMLKPPHPVARLAYMLAMWFNPNNHALDGARASSPMEKEAVAAIAKMFGWREHLGHLTGGGTMANLEALWVAGRLHPGRAVLGSAQAHYTHSRISEVLRLDYHPVATDARGRMDMAALTRLVRQTKPGAVVATLGTTGAGAVDPLPEILALAREHGFRVHVDAAYGGYFTLVSNLGTEARAAFDALPAADSIVIDPHKHGLQPYGCGCVLFRDPSVGRFYKHDSPYTYFSSSDLHLGEISLECSRPGAAAVALWATQRMLPLERGGEFARGLEQGREAALELYRRLQSDPRFLAILKPQLDIILWAPRAASASEISRLSQQQFNAAARANLHLALVALPAELLREHWPEVTFDQQQVKCLRSCLMKPEHLDWLDRIWEILTRPLD